jgi:site-specific DNA-methyltransferase (adenine-specific)
MALRLRELWRVLKPTGSLYLHCDSVTSHYLRLVLDCVFGPPSFKNEVTWQRTAAKGNVQRKYGAVADTLLVYAKRAGAETWNQPYRALNEAYVQEMYRYVEEGTGRRYRLDNITAPASRASRGQIYEWHGQRPPSSRCWIYARERMDALLAEGRIVFSRTGYPSFKRYLDENPGEKVPCIWTDIPPVMGREALGYPTQKPLALLERIIAASSNEGDLVLDPFCGCGTAVVAAQKLGRRWCGIDITSLSVTLMRQRLADSFPEVFPTPGDVPVVGLPRDLAGARMLAGLDKYDFQFWVLTLVGAHPPGGLKRKGADRGVDGEILWRDGEGKLQRAVVSVKGGASVSDTMLKDLLATVEAEHAAVGLFLSLAEPTRPMRNRAAAASEYEMAGTTARYPKIQMLTIEELLAGKRPDLPKSSRLEAHKAARREDGGGQGRLFEG